MKLINKFVLVVILVLALALRFYKLDTVPPSLFGDELDVGYQAYSILHTGKDYYGDTLPIHFHSLADFRTPLYLYASVPTVALFGITSYGVRLPAAIFGVLSIYFLYLLVKLASKNEALALWSALLLTISPWHLQYSRAAFEVTQLLCLYIGGIYFFLRGLREYKYLGLSAVFLALTPWSYNTAKLFLPLTLVAILIIWGKEIIRLPRRNQFIAGALFVVVITPFFISTIFGGGTERFNYLSIFSDPTIEGRIGFDRLQDNGPLNKFFHNRPLYLSEEFFNNYFKAFSTDFLFINGDASNSRQSIQRIGEFYKFEIVLLFLGIVCLASPIFDKKFKAFLIFWTLAGAIPSALTVDGGTHATRLILILPPLVILTSVGAYMISDVFRRYYPKVTITILSFVIALSVLFYLHDYWVHYPLESERLWDAGYEGAVKSAVSLGQNYHKVIISDANEPSLIYFLGWSEYPPQEFQKNPTLEKESLPGFGEVSRLDKYYFTPIGRSQDIYKLASIMDRDSIYMATEKEVRVDLIKDPSGVPGDLVMLKAIPYPSGEGAFYLFAKK